MDAPPNGRAAVEILVGGLFVFAVTYALLIPGRSLWAVLAGWSESVFLLGLIATCVVFGAAFAAITGISVGRFVGGGLAVYALWLWYLEATAGPFDSPVHILVGIFYLVGFGVGAGLVEWAGFSGPLARIDFFE